MSRNVRFLIRAAAVAITTALTLFVMGTAEAVSFELHGRVHKSGAGGGSASGRITFASAHRFSWRGAVRDICPTDGYGVEVQFVVRHTDGTQMVKKNVMEDLDGCGPQSVKRSGTVSDRKRIKNVMIVLYSTQSGRPWVTLAVSSDRDNPHT